VYLVSLGINLVTLPILVGIGMPRILAQALIIVVTTVLSYVGHRYFSFRRPRATGTDAPAADPADAGERPHPGG
jgi:putative flippase GtrA